jgi:hypothetical protein
MDDGHCRNRSCRKPVAIRSAALSRKFEGTILRTPQRKVNPKMAGRSLPVVLVDCLMNHYTLLNPVIGGILIGLASLIATVLSGKVPRISGVFGRLLVPETPDKTWRVIFLLGLIGGAALSFALWESAALFRPMRPLGVMAAFAASGWVRRIQSWPHSSS